MGQAVSEIRNALTICRCELHAISSIGGSHAATRGGNCAFA